MRNITTQTDLDFIKAEILRVGATAAEVRSAPAFVASEMSFDPRAYQALSPRLRRLVDLIAVVGQDAAELCTDDRTELARSPDQGIGMPGRIVGMADSSVGGLTACASG